MGEGVSRVADRSAPFLIEFLVVGDWPQVGGPVTDLAQEDCVAISAVVSG